MSHSDRMAYVADELNEIVKCKSIRFGLTFRRLEKLKKTVDLMDIEELIDEIDGDKCEVK